MSNLYENVAEEFNKRKCQLLTSKEEHAEILQQLKKCKHNYKLHYIASCGHTHNVFYNVFKSRGTGIICPLCKKKENSKIKKEQIQNKEISKTSYIEQEFTCIQMIIQLLQNDFEIIKAFDCCIVDIIFRPRHIIEDKWVGIQVKTTKVRNRTYSFSINNIYKDCLLLFYCFEDEKMWLIPENMIDHQTKVSIGYTKSKYNIYNVSNNNLIYKLNELYRTTSQFAFDKLNLPINIYQQREQSFRTFRDNILHFIPFVYENMEGTVYDFKIGNLKIQEKVSQIGNKNSYCFQLCKNNGKKINNKMIQIQYDIGDNDFYWLNCANQTYFFVIPEKILIERQIIGNQKEKNNTSFKCVVKETLHKNSSWLQPFMFNYENIDKERLLAILH